MTPAVILAALTLKAWLAFPPGDDFEGSVAPVLIRSCIACHNGSDPKGGLDLTRREPALAGGDSGDALVPGAPDDSLVIERVRAGEMPPRGQGDRLSNEEIAALSDWIRSGAAWPDGRVLSPFERTTARRAGYDWWSLQPVRRPPLPTVQDREWPRTPLDADILARLEDRNLRPADAADRLTWIRRVTFDLLGLPPTPDEIDEFVGNDSPEAADRLVDRLLASPHYGERWGRHWLDVARFGESDGFENDKLRAEAWPYRDYVIRSLNADTPFDRFIREQLAGDALPGADRDAIAAGGFLVAGPWDEIQNVGKSPTERLRAHEEQMEELVATVAQGFLGLTVNCSRCHDHKFDPIAQTDYYRFKAVFEGVDHGNRPLLAPDELRDHEARSRPLAERTAQLKKSVADLQSRLGVQIADVIPPAAVVAGRFGETFDPARVRPALRAKPEWQTPPLTVECWTRLRSKGGFNILVAVNAKESSEHWELYSYAGQGDLSFYVPGYSPAEIRSGVDITDGEWHFVAATFDGRRVGLFVDGRQVADVAVERQRAGGATSALYFGAYPPSNIGCDGLVDDVRISRVLRPQDAVPDAPLLADAATIGLWRFDRTPEGRLRDDSPLAVPPVEAPERPTDPDLAAAREELDRSLAELKQVEGELARQAPPLVYAGVRKQPPPTVVFARGDIGQPGATVAPGALSAVRTLSAELGLQPDAPEAERRARFAEWVVDPAQPLTARVIVNRVWQQHFGQGLVETPSDFGFSGGYPSHPELLDRLASGFIEQGWSLKRLHRQIVLSAAYRQSSALHAAAAAMDADNRLLWRFSPRRLEAETVRDAMLAVSGELQRQVGGPSFRPFTVTAINTQFYHLIDDGRPDFNRRTVYRIQVNTAKSPFLDALDCPAPSLAVPRRRHTTTTLQALALMNDSFVQRQAERLATRIGRALADDSADASGAVRLYRLTLGRPPTSDERQATERLIAEHGLESACWALLNASEFLYLR